MNQLAVLAGAEPAQIELAPEGFKGYYPVAETNAPSLGSDLPDTKVVFTETPKGTMLLRREIGRAHV